MTNPVQKIMDKYNIPLAHVAKAVGLSTRTVIRHRQAKGPMRPNTEKMYADLYRQFGWLGSGFFAGRYHRNTYHKIRINLPKKLPWNRVRREA